MKLTVQKTVLTVVDTNLERKRINKGFSSKKDQTIKKKLLKLVGLVEAQDWNKAKKELMSKWWQGRDKELGYPRYEYLGYVDPKRDGDAFSGWESYGDFILALTDKPDKFSIIKVK